MGIKEIRIDKSVIKVFSSFEEAGAEERAYWQKRTPGERLQALELMRQSAYGYEDPNSERLQRVHKIIERK